VRVAGMTHKFPAKPKVSNIERYEHFAAMTQQIGAPDDVKNFERAFQKAFKSAFENRLLETSYEYARRRANPNDGK
jgi:hypothetical protein